MAQRDAEATRAKILAAAREEFAAHGQAGGRIDRIAREADSNVRMIYAYFGNKSGLFDAALSDAITRMAEAVPPIPTDLPRWVGELYDFHRDHPEVLRICLWAQLERPEAASEPLAAYAAKAAAIHPQATPPFSAVDLLVIIYAIAQAWQTAPIGLLSADTGATDASRRAAAIAAVARIVTPGTA
ncbi:TetR family transcriptional regulator [Herbiconiux daphne]|uniref:TetR family transcriptional regulator n=1 Tax=Herbiconiux daphne TaxID=2970914 RepID=A0ABT2H1H9_9MICO|nr:TetR family transcriptional regulator [Herbiconiux daphne]MCS5733766.1 TetR family transcriptional regulator [Herbiconiux daphne]